MYYFSSPIPFDRDFKKVNSSATAFYYRNVTMNVGLYAILEPSDPNHSQYYDWVQKYYAMVYAFEFGLDRSTHLFFFRYLLIGWEYISIMWTMSSLTGNNYIMVPITHAWYR